MAVAEKEIRIVEKIKSGEIPTDFCWNYQPHPLSPIPESIKPEPSVEQAIEIDLVDEGLRDGLHGISYFPTTEEMMRYIYEADNFGIKNLTVGIYSGEKGNKVDKTIKSVLSEMYRNYPQLTPIVLSLATEASMEWVADCKDKNPNLNAIVFRGTAPVRLLVEDWTKEQILKSLADAVKFATDRGIEVIGATEHTTQTPPDFLREIIQVQVENGASKFCIADTIGVARPQGTARIVTFTRSVLDSLGFKNVQIDWHGHRDTGNGLGNAMAAAAAGAKRIHVVAGGIGERAGNTELESIAINLSNILEENGKESSWNLYCLTDLLNTYRDITRLEVPEHGMLGMNAFTSHLGIHSAARYKAEQLVKAAHDLKESALAESIGKMSRTIYTANDPAKIGREHITLVSPWSGKSTVKLALKELRMEGYKIDPSKISEAQIEEVINYAKALGRALSHEELYRIFRNGN